MPIKKVKGGYQWGNHGKIYPTRKQAVKQAAFANGYEEDDETNEKFKKILQNKK